MDNPHLEALLDRYFDGVLDDEARAELEQELLANPDARNRFWERSHLEERLRRCAREAWSEAPALRRLQTAHAGRRPWRALAAVAALAALVTLGVWLSGKWQAAAPPLPLADVPTPPAAPANPPAPPAAFEMPVATVEGTAQAHWRGDSRARGSSLLNQERLHLDQGLAALRFFGGVRVTLRAPADFSPLSESALLLDQGTARIEVPEVAHTFVLRLGDNELSSNQGRFDVQRDSLGNANLHVSDGSLRYRGPFSAAEITLTKGQSLRLDAIRGLVRPLQPAFSFDAPGDEIARNGERRLAEWRSASLKRDADPDLLIHFRMDDPNEEPGGFLINGSSHPAASRQAAVIAADWAEGRWPGKRALAFRHASARARVAIQGTHPRVTFAAWVRLDDPHSHFNGLFLSEPNVRGETHWQLSAEAQFRFAVRPIQPLAGGIYLRAFTERKILPDNQRGVWRLLVTTYDSGRREVIHYVDGVEFERATLLQSVDLRFGLATLGNCAVPPPDRWGPRSLGGVIDEFLLYDRVLPAGEIQALYQEGRLD